MPLVVSTERVSALAAILSRGELERAAGLAFAEQRRRFVVARAFLRIVLGRALGQRPELIDIELDDRGKPRIEGQLRFSVAHSHELAVVALAHGREVGIDIERLRPLSDRAALEQEVLAPAERAALAAFPEERRDAAFLAAWTRKESYLKARGLGLALPPRHVLVELGEPAALITDAARWSLRSLGPANGYVGALVVERG
ncbi:MAG: 4'-phosphopantetheinyl transferase family protein [Gaiellaceae bacterium]